MTENTQDPEPTPEEIAVSKAIMAFWGDGVVPEEPVVDTPTSSILPEGTEMFGVKVTSGVKPDQGIPSTPPQSGLIHGLQQVVNKYGASDPHPGSNAALITEQVTQHAADPLGTRTIPHLPGVDQLMWDKEDIREARDSDGFNQRDITWERYALLTAFSMADQHTVLDAAFEPFMDADEECDWDAPADQNVISLNDWYAPALPGQTALDWCRKNLENAAGNPSQIDSTIVEIHGYGPVKVHGMVSAFYEEAWFVAVTTMDGTIVGWDAGGGVNW